jgi:hypothetical protein
MMAFALALRQVAAMLDGLTGIVRIPRELLYVGLDDLANRGVPASAQDALRALVADLPLVPDAASSAQLIGPRSVGLPCLAALARHVVQGLRDHNLTLAHDRPKLRAERRKLLFYDGAALLKQAPRLEAVLCVVDATPEIADLLLTRERDGLASFVTSEAMIERLGHWRVVRLD